jgi:LPS-assembly lipoprotein
MMFLRPVAPVKFLYALILLLVMVFMQSCGFHLRGMVEISQEFSPLYLKQNSASELARELKFVLASKKITVTSDPSKSLSQIVFLYENRERRVLSVDGNGRVREYLLTYTANFYIRFDMVDGVNAEDVNAKQMTESVSTSRTLLFDSEVVLATTNEAEILYENMRRHAARLILLKLQARATDNSSPADTSDNDSASSTKSVNQTEEIEQ